MGDRLNTHYRINTRLSMMSDKKLMALLSKAKLSSGWGQNGTLEIDGQKVFVKRIPLTELESLNAYSTKNLYRIPTWYNYGVGSAGFGAFRELATHIKTTNWVRDAQCEAFPLLHHHRILTAKKSSPDHSSLKNYVAYWNGSKTIGRFMQDRGESKQHLLLFLEYLTPVSDWMAENPAELSGMFRKAIESIDFLEKNGIVHFDAHIFNWLTDGQNMYLTDFGLVLDSEFELTKSERQFFQQHRHYDYAQVIETFGYALIENHFSLNPSQQKLVEKELELSHYGNGPYVNLLIRAAITLHENKKILIPATTLKYLRRYQLIIKEKNDFFLDIRKGKKTSDKYPARKLRKLLKQVKIIKA